MRKFYLSTALVIMFFAFKVYAKVNCYDNFDEAAGCLSLTNDWGTVYYSIDGTKLTVYGPEQKDENGEYTSSAAIVDNAFANVLGQWHKTTKIPEITEIDITGNITSIGDSAFWRSNIEHINIPSTVTEIGPNAFCSAEQLHDVVIPASVTSIQYDAFDAISKVNGSLSIVIEGDPVTIAGRLAGVTDGMTLYCKQGVDCEGRASSVEYYTKTDDGLYQTVSDNEYFVTAEMMSKGATCDDAENCRAILDALAQGKSFKVGGKYYATLDLFSNHLACTNKQNCEDILAAQNAGTSFKVGSRIYNSIEDFTKGKHVKYRIYTVEEASELAGKKNKVMIRYK